MKITKIHNESDYQNALKRIEELWNIKPDNPDFKEFVRLCNLLETYETICEPVGAKDNDRA